MIIWIVFSKFLFCSWPAQQFLGHFSLFLLEYLQLQWHYLFMFWCHWKERNCLKSLHLELEENLKLSQKITIKILLIYFTCLKYRLHIIRNMLVRGHCEGGHLGLPKNFKTPFFWRYWKYLPWGDSYRSKTSPVFFLFEISQQIWLLEASKVLAKMGRGWQAVWVMAKIFISNLHKLVMNKCWKFQEDILILVWDRAKWLKICCDQWTLFGHFW